ncbi:MAG: hypothetical protein ACKESB_00225 [Candidatus Hodgkinia cicadicola]
MFLNALRAPLQSVNMLSVELRLRRVKWVGFWACLLLFWFLLSLAAVRWISDCNRLPSFVVLCRSLAWWRSWRP